MNVSRLLDGVPCASLTACERYVMHVRSNPCTSLSSNMEGGHFSPASLIPQRMRAVKVLLVPTVG